MIALEATALHTCYAVRPVGALGTCGWINGQPWEVVYVVANSAQEAIERAIAITTRSQQ